MARSVVWNLVADSRQYTKGFKEAERTTKRFSGMVTKTAGLIGGAFAAVEIGGFLKDAIGEAREAAKVTRQTNAVIKATGGVAHVTAKGVNALADALSVKVGVDDEVIAAGENMLLTFKGVRNEAGKNNDVFNQATKIALDMTAALNQGEVSQSGLEQSTIRLGKALNNPIQGISALTRVGVTFTDAQKKQIKTLVESGKTMDAQKIILKELATEFGGAAAAAADPWSRLQVAFGNVKEAIGTALLPAFDAAADWLSRALPAAIDKTKEALRVARDWWDKNYHSIRVLIDTLSADYGRATSDATGSTDDLRTSAEKLRHAFDTLLEWSLRLAQGYNLLGQLSQILSKGILTVVRGGGLLINVLDRLQGGTGHAADEIIHFADVGLRKADRMLDQLGNQAHQTQKEIDKLHGKDVTITAKGVWVPPKGFSTALGKPSGFAAGGPISGPGTGTSDSILARLSTGEHVLSAREVRGLGGHGAVETLRRQARGFAQGGPVGPASLGLGPHIQRSIDRLAAAIDRLTIKVPISGASIPHVPGAWQMAVSFLKAVGVPANVISSFRPGARTHASGAVSYHALNRAVDLTGPNMLNIWRALTGTNPTELIYSRAPFYKSRSGWHPISRLDPITRADHFSHVHAAYKRGGRIPEDVFGVGRSGRTYGFHGGETVVPKNGNRELARMIAQELAQVIPTTVAVDDIHRGLKAKKRGQSGIPLGLA